MPSSLAAHWRLEPGFDYLNHGSFGACPTAVLEAQRALRDRVERQAIDFLVRELRQHLALARAPLAAMVGAATTDLVFVRNATQGVNAILRSLTFEPGDQLLVTDHGYGACTKAARFVARRWGAEVVVARLPVPLDPTRASEAILAAVTDRTRLALIDHVTSPTGMVLPIADIVAGLDARGVEHVLVDGAHAPGMVPLDLDALGQAGCHYYAANCHKWLCAPKGAALLWVRPDRQEGIVPTSISHGYDVPPERLRDMTPFQALFDWTGTDDVTAALSVPAAIAAVGGMLEGGWRAVMAHNHALALQARQVLRDALGAYRPDPGPLCPDSMIGSLAAVPLPPAPAFRPAAPLDMDPLQQRLRTIHRIEVPIVHWPGDGHRLVRVSAQLYNDIDQYHRLAAALGEELARERVTAAAPGS